MARWRYATEEETQEFQETPPVKDVDVDLRGWQNHIYPVLEGVVRNQTGDTVEVPPDMVVKVLEDRVEEPWCYEVLEMQVESMGQKLTLKEGTWIAIFRTEHLVNSQRMSF